MSNRENEAHIVNQNAEALIERFKAEGREVEAVVTVVLFKTPGDRRDFHVAQSIDANSEAEANELFCECASRLNDEAVKVVRKRRSS
jgi:hypothetical protein